MVRRKRFRVIAKKTAPIAVVVEQRTRACGGAILVALIRGQDATLKRIYQEPGRITLRAENPDVAPLEYPLDDVEIRGILVGQVRRYR